MNKFFKLIKFVPSLLVLFTIAFIILKYIGESGSDLLSFEKAYKIAKSTALQWDSKCLLYNAGSVDTNDEVNYKNYKRAGWNFDFTLINSEKHYIIEIRNGQVTSSSIVYGNKVPGVPSYFLQVYKLQQLHILDRKVVQPTIQRVIKWPMVNGQKLEM